MDSDEDWYDGENSDDEVNLDMHNTLVTENSTILTYDILPTEVILDEILTFYYLDHTTTFSLFGYFGCDPFRRVFFIFRHIIFDSVWGFQTYFDFDGVSILQRNHLETVLFKDFPVFAEFQTMTTKNNLKWMDLKRLEFYDQRGLSDKFFQEHYFPSLKKLKIVRTESKVEKNYFKGVNWNINNLARLKYLTIIGYQGVVANLFGNPKVLKILERNLEVLKISGEKFPNLLLESDIFVNNIVSFINPYCASLSNKKEGFSLDKKVYPKCKKLSVFKNGVKVNTELLEIQFPNLQKLQLTQFDLSKHSSVNTNQLTKLSLVLCSGFKVKNLKMENLRSLHICQGNVKFQSYIVPNLRELFLSYVKLNSSFFYNNKLKKLKKLSFKVVDCDFQFPGWSVEMSGSLEEMCFYKCTFGISFFKENCFPNVKKLVMDKCYISCRTIYNTNYCFGKFDTLEFFHFHEDQSQNRLIGITFDHFIVRNTHCKYKKQEVYYVTGCFGQDMMAKRDNGELCRIVDLQKGMKILTTKGKYSKIISVVVHKSRERPLLSFNGGRLTVTKDHLIFLYDSNRKKKVLVVAKDVCPGMNFLQSNGDYEMVKRKDTVYNTCVNVYTNNGKFVIFPSSSTRKGKEKGFVVSVFSSKIDRLSFPLGKIGYKLFGENGFKFLGKIYKKTKLY